jgi:hypothetical protein
MAKHMGIIQLSLNFKEMETLFLVSHFLEVGVQFNVKPSHKARETNVERRYRRFEMRESFHFRTIFL